MSKYSICLDCYYNHREPAICEGCANGSEFEPNVGTAAEAVAGGGSKKIIPLKQIKVMKKRDTL